MTLWAGHRATLLLLIAVTLIPAIPAAHAADADDGGYSLASPAPGDKLREMDADWPDKTDTPLTIDAGYLQAEIGLVDYTYDEFRLSGAHANVETFTTGVFQLRLGVTDDLELELNFDSYSQMHEQDHVARTSSHADGIGDLTFGGKLNLWGNDSDEDWSTGLGVQPLVKLPSAASNIGNGHAEAGLGFPFLLNLPDDIKLGAQATFQWQRNSLNTGYVGGWEGSITTERSVVEDVDMYLEYWVSTTTERHLESEQTVDIGAFYQLTPNLLLTTAVNLGLTRAADKIEWLSGFAIRF